MMQIPIQAAPRPREFMQLIVGKQWSPKFEPTPQLAARFSKSGKRPKRKKLKNPCLLQLSVFSGRKK